MHVSPRCHPWASATRIRDLKIPDAVLPALCREIAPEVGSRQPDTKFCLPAIFDLEKQEVIWADISLANNPRFANNVYNHLSGVSLMLRAMSQLQKTDLRTLFDLHIRARGEMIADIQSARSVIAVDRGVTPFDLDRIAADFM